MLPSPPLEGFTWDPARNDLITSVLRLIRPLPPPDGLLTIKEICAFPSNADVATTLLRSLQHGVMRIVLKPSPIITGDGILSIDLDISPQVDGGDGAEEYRRLWDSIIARAAPRLAIDLASAIETELRAHRRPE